jgi:hypothetical protein
VYRTNRIGDRAAPGFSMKLPPRLLDDLATLTESLDNSSVDLARLAGQLAADIDVAVSDVGSITLTSIVDGERFDVVIGTRDPVRGGTDSGASEPRSLADVSEVNQAIGVLVASGRTVAEARAELRRVAERWNRSTVDEAGRTLRDARGWFPPARP